MRLGLIPFDSMKSSEAFFGKEIRALRPKERKRNSMFSKKTKKTKKDHSEDDSDSSSESSSSSSSDDIVPFIGDIEGAFCDARTKELIQDFVINGFPSLEEREPLFVLLRESIEKALVAILFWRIYSY
jgi:hypothetical protein